MMINFQININNPWWDRWNCLYTKDGQTLFENKHWEVQLDRCNDIIGLHFRVTARQDHAGVLLSLALFGYDIIFSVYDCRHWDYDNKCWFNYEKNSHE